MTMMTGSFLLLMAAATFVATDGFLASSAARSVAKQRGSTALNSEAAAPTAESRPRGTGGYDGEFIDEAAVFEDWEYPFPHDKLVEMAKRMYDDDVTFGTKDGGNCLAADVEFCAAVVGPLGKEEYLTALANFDLEESFDIRGNVYGFTADPMQPGRVWFFNRAKAKHVQKFLGAEPTGKVLELPPQLNFFQFDRRGKVREYGFYTVDRRQGNTGGLGGAYGYMYGVGRSPPFPEARPHKPSRRYRLFNFVVGNLQKLASKKKNEEKKESAE